MLDVKNLFCGYDGRDVVENVSFSLKKGEILCLAGPNGCGKTTLLRAVTGLLPSRGDVSIRGKDIRSMKRSEIAAKTAMFSQTSGISFPYTVFETVMMGRYPHIPKGLFSGHTARDRAFVEECVERVGLSDEKDRLITQLSGGQLQRVMLARVFAQDPAIILLDEPTNHLDIRHQIETVNYIKEWVKTGERAVFAVFHDLNLTMTVADKVLLMERGVIAGEGSARDMLAGAKISEIYGMDVAAYMRETLSLWS